MYQYKFRSCISNDFSPSVLYLLQNCQFFSAKIASMPSINSSITESLILIFLNNSYILSTFEISALTSIVYFSINISSFSIDRYNFLFHGIDVSSSSVDFELKKVI
ncbi:hypothetical protein MXB_4541, partial [Myxobolus squamalis]